MLPGFNSADKYLQCFIIQLNTQAVQKKKCKIQIMNNYKHKEGHNSVLLFSITN